MKIIEEKYIIDCGELLSIYNLYLKPYLGVNRVFINEEQILMEELFRVLNFVDSQGPKTILDAFDGIFIPTDVRDYFVYKLNGAIDIMIATIDITLKGKILVDLSPIFGHSIMACCIRYDYNEGEYDNETYTQYYR